MSRRHFLLAAGGLAAGAALPAAAQSNRILPAQDIAPLIGAILNGVGSKLEYGYTYGGDDRYYLETPEPDRKSRNDTRNGSGKGNGKGNGSAGTGKGRSRTSTPTSR